MKKTFTYLRTLLVGLMAVTATGTAWAETGDVTTNANINFSNDVVEGAIAGTYNSITLGGSNTVKGANGSGNLILGNGTSTVTIPSAEYAGTRDKVTIAFDIAFGKLSGKEVFFNAKDASNEVIFNVSYNVYSNTFSANTLELSGDDWYHGYNTVIWDRSASLSIEIDYAAKTIKTTVTDNYAKKTYNHTVGLTNTNPVATFNVGSNYNNDGRRCEFDNLMITTTEGNYDVTEANYTIKYMCEDEEIKEAAVRKGDAESSITLLASDKATFDADGQRYIYESDDLGEKTVAGDGSTVVTITFRKAAKYSYTINSKYDETTLDFSASGSVWEDENNITVQFPKYYIVGTTLIIAPLLTNGEPKKNFTIANDGYTGEIEYTSTGITNAYFLSEAENLGATGLTTSNNTGANDRCSNAAIAYGSSATLLTLPAGKYIFTLGAWGGAGHEWSFEINAGSKKIIDNSCSQNTLKLVASEEFELFGTTNITFKANDPGSTRGIDLIYIQKTGDVELPANVTVNVTAAGYATYCSQYDLDLSSVESAYTATLDGTNISFTKQTGKVAAGTGLLIKAAEGTVNIPVVATGASAVADNALIGVLASTAVPAGSFVLMGSPTVGFYKANNEFTVGANTAYIAALPEASRTFIALDGDATGIKAINAAEVAEGIYNLQGQRVAKAQKGLYIVNGKKAIVK